MLKSYINTGTRSTSYRIYLVHEMRSSAPSVDTIPAASAGITTENVKRVKIKKIRIKSLRYRKNI